MSEEILDPLTTSILEKMERANDAGDTAVTAIFERLKLCVSLGTDLRNKKKQLAHGEWLPWLQENIMGTDAAKVMLFSANTARNYMRLSEMQEQGTLDLEEAQTLRRAYVLAGILPESAEGTPGGGTENEPQIFVKLRRVDTMIQSHLTRQPLDKWTERERKEWIERLRPMVALHNMLLEN